MGLTIQKRKKRKRRAGTIILLARERLESCGADVLERRTKDGRHKMRLRIAH